ncbi:hypothetical protein C8F04DRAFT_1203025 [Mycena alexandri]|uniref:TEA domain-containing protein n=1 Tax=Mycena alexandri TaxID=1745969 RepID=A0AAD6RXB0_9AGAR|nr:hypothetical protein C8F04DRAFT_1203025 [Mycena alexandri]
MFNNPRKLGDKGVVNVVAIEGLAIASANQVAPETLALRKETLYTLAMTRADSYVGVQTGEEDPVHLEAWFVFVDKMANTNDVHGFLYSAGNVEIVKVTVFSSNDAQCKDRRRQRIFGRPQDLAALSAEHGSPRTKSTTAIMLNSREAAPREVKLYRRRDGINVNVDSMLFITIRLLLFKVADVQLFSQNIRFHCRRNMVLPPCFPSLLFTLNPKSYRWTTSKSRPLLGVSMADGWSLIVQYMSFQLVPCPVPWPPPPMVPPRHILPKSAGGFSNQAPEGRFRASKVWSSSLDFFLLEGGLLFSVFIVGSDPVEGLRVFSESHGVPGETYRVGRNAFISAFIRKASGHQRSVTQVSSRLQKLAYSKNVDPSGILMLLDRSLVFEHHPVKALICCRRGVHRGPSVLVSTPLTAPEPLSSIVDNHIDSPSSVVDTSVDVAEVEVLPLDGKDQSILDALVNPGIDPAFLMEQDWFYRAIDGPTLDEEGTGPFTAYSMFGECGLSSFCNY